MEVGEVLAVERQVAGINHVGCRRRIEFVVHYGAWFQDQVADAQRGRRNARGGISACPNIELPPLSVPGGSPGARLPLADTVTLAKLPVPPRVPPLLTVSGLASTPVTAKRLIDRRRAGVGVGSCDGKRAGADLLQAAGTGKGAGQGEGVAIGVENGIVPRRAEGDGHAGRKGRSGLECSSAEVEGGRTDPWSSPGRKDVSKPPLRL